jgi:creatinine amidohydrolase
MADNPGTSVRFFNWYNAPKTWAKVQEIDPIASHASWMENFPWTRIANVATPDERKPMINGDRLKLMDPKKVREYLGDGNFGGLYRRSDEEMLALWAVAVAETRGVIEGPWS